MSKTSVSHPLQIDTVRPRDCSGEIGLTLCPGKKQHDAASGSWDRDLELDLAKITEWSPAAVVTLLEKQEFGHLNVPGLPTLMRGQAFDWYHLPIDDGSVPAESFECAWYYVGTRLRAKLRGGEKVLVHCKGGLGRAGMVATRLLIELGEDPLSAMARVRQARPGTIENAAQEAYVQRQVHVPANVDARRERVLGSLFGGAVGDAFGYEVEFKLLAAIQRQYGAGGLREPVFHDGRLVVSDDTQMTLFTLDALNRSADALKAHDLDTATANVRAAYLDWLSTQRDSWKPSVTGERLLGFPELYKRRAPGNTCLAALEAGGHGTISQPINDSKGCGTVMRTAPIGFLCHWLEDREVFELAARASAITHGHPDGIAAGAAMAVIIANCLRGESIRSAAEHAMAMAAQWREGLDTVAEMQSALARAAAPAAQPLDDVTALGEGWVAEEALAVGLYSALIGTDFSNALCVAANHNGDSDSTASIAGQIYGAAHGIGPVPHRWVAALDVWQPLMMVARKRPDIDAS